jgi:hypothetical protein
MLHPTGHIVGEQSELRLINVSLPDTQLQHIPQFEPFGNGLLSHFLEVSLHVSKVQVLLSLQYLEEPTQTPA